MKVPLNIASSTWILTIALSLALFINSAILILVAAVFHFSGKQDVAEIQDAYKLLSPIDGRVCQSYLAQGAGLCSSNDHCRAEWLVINPDILRMA